ncbi:MAG: carboxymuconolactone decarboxylase family protein [Planctomycetota bacterium]|jgi:AhpD family alkylhydroperoxidase
MLPSKLRLWLFDRLSVKTMRYVSAVPRSAATGLTREVYDMIADDFFINGSLTSRSSVPNLMAAIWTTGRESMLVDDALDRTTKEAICAVVSDLNDCPYCGDMLVSLVHAGEEHEAASALFESTVRDISDPALRAKLAWVEALSTPGRTDTPPLPFSADELPEVIASMLGMADINRFSHVVMDGSPVDAGRWQGMALRLFGNELQATKRRKAEPGRALALLPPAELPEDLEWATPNPRIADSLARWAATVERETAEVISPAVKRCVNDSLEPDVAELGGEDQAIARLAIVLAKAPHQVAESLVEPLVTDDESRFVRILAWSASVGARRFGSIVADRALGQLQRGDCEIGRDQHGSRARAGGGDVPAEPVAV